MLNADSAAQLIAARAEVSRLRRYVPAVVADSALFHQDRLRGERREVSILFVDVVNFTELSISLDAEAIFNSPRGVTLGNKDGDVTFVEFFDYNCGYCKRAMSDMLDLMKTDSKLKVVLKEFPAHFRSSLAPFTEDGFARISSMPYTVLDITFRDFDEYMQTALSHAYRKNLRRKFRKHCPA